MNIQTKFNLNDTVYICDDIRNILQYRIVQINIKVFHEDDIRISYEISNGPNNKVLDEFKLFKTKEECKEYLVEYIKSL